MKKAFKYITNIQILSALIWAATIILCSYFVQSGPITSILITAAGFHVILLARTNKVKETNY